MKTVNKTYIENVKVRLANLPWQWVRVDEIFDDVEELYRFATALSKDGPDVIAVAVRSTEVGYELLNIDLDTLRYAFGGVWMRSLGAGKEYFAFFSSIYVPFGFALDVAEWCRLTDGQPVGEWIDFADLARDGDEGGDRDRWFAAHYVGPSWWVVPFPEQ